MPLSRHTVANEYSLGGRELYKRADQHDPEAVLDGVAMAGLVGVLRQLGDLAEFAAQVFHGLYDEVMTASARGHGLVLRVQQLEAELPLAEKESCQRDYLYVASNRGVDWHANLTVDHGVVTRGDTPRFIMESIKQCHGPPRLFMLDKYDIGGEGTCLKRYTDPAFFKTDSACSSMLQEGIRRERRPLRAMEIRPNLQNFEIFRPPNTVSSDAKLETDLSGEALDEVPTRRRQLKYRQLNGSVFRSFGPQMRGLYEKASSEEKPSYIDQSEVQISFSDSPDTNAEERDIMVDTSSSMDKGKEGHCSAVCKNMSTSEKAPSRSSDTRSAGSSKGYNSEVDIYVDALTTMGSEVETDSEYRDYGRHAFAPVTSGKTCSDAHSAAVSRSSSFSEEEDSPMLYSSDVGSANRDKADHYEEDATVSIPQAKPVAGEHERTSSLEELFAQEKPVSCEHERTNSLEELLTGDVLVSEPDMRELATKTNTNDIFSNATRGDIVDSTKKANENNIATISLKKTASKRSKYVGSMELFASKVGILPRKLSKRHDPFSDSLRNMAKELLELKCDVTQDSDLYDFEANGEECDMDCLEMPHPPVEIKEESVRQSISSDSPQDVVGSSEFHTEEVNQDSDHDIPPTDSSQDSVPDGNGFQHSDMIYFTDITSPTRKEEGREGAAPGERSSAGMLDHASELIQEQIEDVHTEIVSENASDMGEELKEVCICEERVNAENAEECAESNEYASDDEITDYIEEQVVPDAVISLPILSEQSDDPCRISPLTLRDDKIAIASEGVDCTPEKEHITLLEIITETDQPEVVTESVIRSEAIASEGANCTPEMEHITLLETITETDQPKVVTEPVIRSEAIASEGANCTPEMEHITLLDTIIGTDQPEVVAEPVIRSEAIASEGVNCTAEMEHITLLETITETDQPKVVTEPVVRSEAIASEGANCTPEMEHITLLETITETDQPKVVNESVIRSEAAMPHNEQCYLHPETSFAQDSVLSSCEVISQNEQLQLCSSSLMASTPDIAVNTEEKHVLHQPVHHEPLKPCSSSTEIFGNPLAPDSRDVPLPNISSFDWMLNGAMQQSLNVIPAQPTYGISQGNVSSEDTGDAWRLPPLPPMQWRTAKLQTGSTNLFARLGRPPRPKPPAKQQESESNSSLDKTNEEAEKLQENPLDNGFTSQKEMAQATVCNEIQTNLLLGRDSQENQLQEGYKEYDVQASILLSTSEAKSAADVASVEGDNLHTLQLSELIVIPEDAWSELVDIEPVLQQENERKQELKSGVSDCDGTHTAGLSAQKTNEEHERSDQKENEFSAADSSMVADSEENKPNGLLCQDDTQNLDVSVQQEDVEHGSSDEKARQFSSALEEELAKLPPHPVPEPPKYPLLQVISHDRSMLRKAPTLVQPSSKLSEEKNTMLEQIKNKSVNLKPVIAKRPNVMGGPRTNLQVVAILERANAIRQAVADDDDEDSWSE